MIMNRNSIFQKASLLFLTASLIGTAAVAQFSGAFAPGNWTLVKTPPSGNGTVNTAGAPASITVIGSDNGFALGPGADTRFQIVAPSAGIVTASWSFHTNDCQGAYWDPAYYAANGVITQLTNDAGAVNQSGTLAFSVLAGQVLGFGVYARDNFCGNATLTITNFVFTDISCGNNGDKIQICHKPGENNAKTLCIGLDGLADHLGHGDYVGPCGSPVTASPLTSPRPGENIFTAPVPQRLNAELTGNPTTTYFTLKLQGFSTEKITIKMTDALGRQVEVIQNLTAGQTVQIGGEYAPGMYVAEMVQGNQHKTIKLLKIE
jgi:hypothetical protein